MPYLPRYLIIYDDCTFHMTWRCHNKDWLIKWDWAKQLYRDLLLRYKDKYHIQIYSCTFMDNHPHITGHIEDKGEFSAFLRIVNSLFARTVNKRLGRCGQLVMDRPKSPLIEDDVHHLTTITYGDLNSVRAGKVKHPKDYKWSSYHYYAYGKDDPLITPAPSYLALGETPEARQRAYREMVDALLEHPREINVSHTYFIGNPDWVISKYRQLREFLHRAVSCSAPT